MVGGGASAVTVSNGLITIGTTGSAGNWMTVTNANLWSSGLITGSGSSNNTVTVLGNSGWNMLGNAPTIGTGAATGNVLIVNGGAVSFSRARFNGSTVTFDNATFSGNTVDFTDPGDWSCPPTFPWTGTPPPGVKLPQIEGQPKS